MIQTFIASMALIAGLITPQVAAQVKPADAEPFVGDWTLALQGPNGPGTFDLTIKVEKEKVVGEIKNQDMPAQAITDITKVEKSLVLRYSFDYQGNPVDAAVSLTPAEGGKTNAENRLRGRRLRHVRLPRPRRRRPSSSAKSGADEVRLSFQSHLPIVTEILRNTGGSVNLRLRASRPARMLSLICGWKCARCGWHPPC